MILGSGLLTASGKTTLTLYTTKSGTFNPTIVASDTSGITWDFGDGSATYTGGTPSHSYADGTQKTVRITFDDPTLVTQLNFNSLSMTGEWPISMLAKFTALTQLSANGNLNLNVSGAFSEIPATVTTLNIGNSSSTVAGVLADLPPGLVVCNISATDCDLSGALTDLPSTITTLLLSFTNGGLSGNLSDLPVGFSRLYVDYTPSNIGGGSSAIAAPGIWIVYLQNSSTTQANIDDILLRLYTDRASFTHPTPILNVGGTNPNPTGTYADATPPTTGLEYAYKLVNDPDAEGFRKWTITY